MASGHRLHTSLIAFRLTVVVVVVGENDGGRDDRWRWLVMDGMEMVVRWE